MAEYGNEHRLFVQSMVSRGILDSFEVRELFRCCCKRYDVEVVDTKMQLARFMKLCNTMLDLVGMKIKKVVDEDAKSNDSGGNVFYVLCNILDRGYGQKFDKTLWDFSQKEVEYIRHLMNLILASEEKQISRNEALNACKDVRNVQGRFTLQDGEKAVVRFVQKRWFKFSPDQSCVRLAPRFLAEMEPYLLKLRSDAVDRDENGEEFVDEEHPGSGVGDCKGCNHMAIRGVACRSCDCFFHLRCVANRDGCCPNCKERTISLPAASSSSQQQRASKRKASRGRRLSSDEED